MYSDFSEDVGRGSQLAREWRDGLMRAEALGKRCWLIAVTNHASLPKGSISKQLYGVSYLPGRLSWLGWSTIARFVSRVQAPEAIRWCADLYELLSRMGLAPFDGFGRTIELSRGLPGVSAVAQVLWQEGQVSPSFARSIGVATHLGQELAWVPSLTTQPVVGFKTAIDEANKYRSRRLPWIPRLNS